MVFIFFIVYLMYFLGFFVNCKFEYLENNKRIKIWVMENIFNKLLKFLGFIFFIVDYC